VLLHALSMVVLWRRCLGRLSERSWRRLTVLLLLLLLLLLLDEVMLGRRARGLRGTDMLELIRWWLALWVLGLLCVSLCGHLVLTGVRLEGRSVVWLLFYGRGRSLGVGVLRRCGTRWHRSRVGSRRRRCTSSARPCLLAWLLMLGSLIG